MSDAKITVKLDNLKTKIQALANELKQEKFGQTITKEIVGKIKKVGYNYKTGGVHDPLKPSTIERRRQLEAYNKLDPFYQASKSNLTFTGRLLNSIKARITSKKRAIVLTIDVGGSHAPYKYKGKEVGKRKSNKEIRKHLAAQGRDPLDLSKKNRDGLSQILMAIMKERLFK